MTHELWLIVSGIGINLLERLQYPWQPAFKSEKEQVREGKK